MLLESRKRSCIRSEISHHDGRRLSSGAKNPIWSTLEFDHRPDCIFRRSLKIIDVSHGVKSLNVMQLSFSATPVSSASLERKISCSEPSIRLACCSCNRCTRYSSLARSFSLLCRLFLFGCLLWIVIFGLTNSMLLSKASFLRSELPCSTAGDLALTVLTMNQIEFATTATDGGQRLSRRHCVASSG